MKRFALKGLFVSAAIACFAIMHLSFAFSTHKDTDSPIVVLPAVPATDNTVPTEHKAAMELLYDSLQLDELGLSEDAFNYAVKGFESLKKTGKIHNERVLSIIDFTKPSSQKRLFVLDVESFKILFNTYVAHGRNTGEAFASHFSNQPESYQSSLGFYITEGTYTGKNGYSMQLEGMEYGINHRAEERAIVVHGAPYVSEGFIRSKGYIGRSHGCPALPEKLNKPIIEKIKNGSCLFIYSNDKAYLQHSKLLNT
jgi:hypothetical protein